MKYKKIVTEMIKKQMNEYDSDSEYSEAYSELQPIAISLADKFVSEIIKTSRKYKTIATPYTEQYFFEQIISILKEHA